MSIFEGILFGIVQGVGEFLPISSSGHLILLSQILSVEPSLYFNVILHFATLMSVVVVFWKDLLLLCKKPFCKYNFKLLVTTLTTIAIVLIINNFCDVMPQGIFLSMFFLLTATMLLIIQILPQGEQNPTFVSAFACGVFQGFAVFGGLSRSGSTMFAQRVVGTNATDSARFSFLASIPIIVASMVYELIFGSGGQIFWLPTIVAFFVSFFVGIFALKLVYRVFSKGKYQVFIIYLIFVAIVSAIL